MLTDDITPQKNKSVLNSGLSKRQYQHSSNIVQMNRTDNHSYQKIWVTCKIYINRVCLCQCSSGGEASICNMTIMGL